MSNVSSCTAAPLPLTGGGAPVAAAPVAPSYVATAPVAAAPTSTTVNGGGGQSPMQVPTTPSSVAGAAGGGELVQPGAAPMPTSVAEAPMPTSAAPADPTAVTADPAAATAAPADPAAVAGTTGGGPTELATALEGLKQALAGLEAVLAQMQGAAAPTGTDASGGGAPGKGVPHEAGCPMAAGTVDAASGAGALPPMKPVDASGSGAPQKIVDPAPVQQGFGPTATSPSQIANAPLAIKGAPIDPEQRANIEQVLQVGKEMGANRKVLVSAVATMIQESVAKNVDYGDRDSLGLFQQRPSMGWGTPEQVRDPRHAAMKYFEQAIPSDSGNPNQSITQLAQSVQRSGLPDAYAQWEGEANAAVDAFGA